MKVAGMVPWMLGMFCKVALSAHTHHGVGILGIFEIAREFSFFQRSHWGSLAELLWSVGDVGWERRFGLGSAVGLHRWVSFRLAMWMRLGKPGQTPTPPWPPPYKGGSWIRFIKGAGFGSVRLGSLRFARCLCGLVYGLFGRAAESL